MLRTSIVGASGYVGGELLRLMLEHPELTPAQVTSERRSGQFVHGQHPNLRGRTDLRFTSLSELAECDVLFLALPHGQAAREIGRFSELAEYVVDCSADFRLRDAGNYESWYKSAHAAPDWLERFTYGLPELHRDTLRGSKFTSGVGCNATACNLALLPLARAGVIDTERGVVCDVKVGSSEAGNVGNDASHHPERSGSVRSYAPTGHRHTAEVQQALGIENVHLSVTAIEMVRGALATCHLWLKEELSEKDLWRFYRGAYQEEPFVRIVHERTGIYRQPEPKILSGSNYADVGWTLDPENGRLVALCAIDNIMKGAAGSAVQSLNLMCGFEEETGLGFSGLHPI